MTRFDARWLLLGRWCDRRVFAAYALLVGIDIAGNVVAAVNQIRGGRRHPQCRRRGYCGTRHPSVLADACGCCYCRRRRRHRRHHF